MTAVGTCAVYRKLLETFFLPFYISEHFCQRLIERKIEEKVICLFIYELSKIACTCVYIANKNADGQVRVWYKGFVFVLGISTKSWLGFVTVYRSYIKNQEYDIVIKGESNDNTIHSEQTQHEQSG